MSHIMIDLETMSTKPNADKHKNPDILEYPNTGS